MWIAFAAGSAFFAGLTSVLTKCGLHEADSDAAALWRTAVVLIFSWLIVWSAGSFEQIHTISPKTWWFLILSGLATGASWLCYFRALQLGPVNQVVSIDKCSTVLTVLLAFLLLKESLSFQKLAGLVLMLAGTLWMTQKKDSVSLKKSGRSWLIYALMAAVFASLNSIFGKIGISGVESNLGTALRTVVVLIMAGVVVLVKKKQQLLFRIPGRDLFYIVLSGMAAGSSWLCYYRALQEGPASVVVPVDKLSLLVTVGFSYLFFRETLSKKEAAGLAAIVLGTFLML